MHVLIVDDQPYMRITTKLLLRELPTTIKVSEVSNGRDAIDFVAKNQPDLILMDIRMPVLDGIEATKQIKTQHPAIEIIALSYIDDYEEEALAAGVDKFILKQGDSLPFIKEIIRSYHNCENWERPLAVYTSDTG